MVWFAALSVSALGYFLIRSDAGDEPALKIEPGRTVRWRDPSAVDAALGLSGMSTGVVYRKTRGHLGSWDVRRDVDGQIVSLFERSLEVTG